MDHDRWLLCPPTSPILHGGCNLNGRSLPHTPLSGCSTTTNATIPRPTLVNRFAMKNAGINEPFAKTNRLPDCCRRGHPEGPFFVGLALARNAPTGNGRQPSTICAGTSTRPLAPARKRLPAAIGSSMNTPLVLAASALLTLSAFRVSPSRSRAPNYALQSLKILPPWRLSLC